MTGPSTCSACGEDLDDLDRLLTPLEPGNRRRCLACHDAAAPAEAGRPIGAPGAEGTAMIGVRELRNQVAAVVRRAAAGERLVVTVDGRPMAQIGPLTAPGAPSLADLAAAGLVEPPRTSSPPAAPHAEDLPADVRLDLVLGELRGR